MNILASLVLVFVMVPIQAMVSIKDTMLSVPYKICQTWNNASNTQKAIAISVAVCAAGCMARHIHSKSVSASESSKLPHILELPCEPVSKKDSEFDISKDMLLLYQLLQAEWPQLYNAEYPGNADPLVANRFVNKKLGNSKVYIKVLRINDEIAGFITYYKTSSTVGHIDLLAVVEKYRKQGIGQRLLEQAESHFRLDQSIQMLDILVLFSNCNAQRLYKKLGFTSNVDTHLSTWICLKKTLNKF